MNNEYAVAQVNKVSFRLEGKQQLRVILDVWRMLEGMSVGPRRAASCGEEELADGHASPREGSRGNDREPLGSKREKAKTRDEQNTNEEEG